MRLLEVLTTAFIDTFGITHPTPQARRRASWFILALLVLAFLVVAAGGSVMYQMLRR